MKLTNIVIVLALACVPVQSDDFAKNLRGESAVGVPEKEQDVTAQKESTDEEVGAVLAELDTSAEATEGVDEQERAARVCKRWVTCTNGFLWRYSLLRWQTLHALAALSFLTSLE